MFQVKTGILFGENTLGRIRDFGGGVALIVCGKHLRKSKTLKIIEESLNEKPVVFDRVSPEPSVEDIQGYWNEIRDKNFDFIVAVGGGSVLDVSKVLAALEANDRGVEDFIGRGNVENDIRTLVAVPTTSGSGSEVTKYAVVKYRGFKATIVSEKICPTAAIVDPLLTVSLPEKLTAYSALDALTHNLEAFLSTKSSPFTDVIASEGIRLGLDNIERACLDGTDLAARTNLALASVFGGIAITNASAGIVHALSHVLGGMFPVEHGLANAMFLPHYVKFNYNDKIKKIEGELGIDLFRHLVDLNERLGIKGVGEFTDEGRVIAEKAYANRRLNEVNPRKVTLDDLVGIVDDSM